MGGINEEPYHGLIETTFFITTVAILAYSLPIYITILVLTPLVFKLYIKLTTGFCKSYRRIDGKTVIVTGSNTGIGLETAKELARRGARVILACRNLDKGKTALEEIKCDTGNNDLALKHLDLSSLSSVRKFCKEINAEESRLDILVNNAGLMVLNETKVLTEDKLEPCLQANHFAPFLLTNLLLGLMQRTGNARIINLSSFAHKFVRSIDIDNWNSEKSFATTFRLYSVSKLANIYFTTELKRRLQNKGITDITVNAVHPGAVRTGMADSQEKSLLKAIASSITQFFLKNAVEGAQTSIHVAISEEIEGVSGLYFSDCAESSTSSLSKDASIAADLWEKSAKAVNLKKEETIF